MVVVFISESGYAIYCRNARVLAKFHPGLHEGVDVRTDELRTYDFLRTKTSWMLSLPNYLTYGAPLRALRARELRYNYEKRAGNLQCTTVL